MKILFGMVGFFVGFLTAKATQVISVLDYIVFGLAGSIITITAYIVVSRVEPKRKPYEHYHNR